MNTTNKKIQLTGIQKPTLERTDSLQLLYGDIRPYKTLSKKETEILFHQYHNGTEKEKNEAIDKLCKHNMRLVIALAKEYCSNEDNLNDLIQEGNIGLLKAIEMFDINNGAPFHGYAVYWIRRYINIFRTNLTPIIRQTNRSKTANVIISISNELLQKLERVPTPDEILDVYNTRYPKKKIRDASDIVNVEYVFIDQFDSTSENPQNFQGFTEYNNASTSYNSYLDDIEKDYNHEMLYQLIDCLNDKEKGVIRELFGLNDGIGHGERIIGGEMGITQQGVNNICRKALKKMRKRSKELNYRFSC